MRGRKQRTFSVDGERIRIVSQHKSYCRHYDGWLVTINNVKYRTRSLCYREDAEDAAYVKWVKGEREPSRDGLVHFTAEMTPRTAAHAESHECVSVTTADGHGSYCKICGETLA